MEGDFYSGQRDHWSYPVCNVAPYDGLISPAWQQDWKKLEWYFLFFLTSLRKHIFNLTELTNWYLYPIMTHFLKVDVERRTGPDNNCDTVDASSLTPERNAPSSNISNTIFSTKQSAVSRRTSTNESVPLLGSYCVRSSPASRARVQWTEESLQQRETGTLLTWIPALLTSHTLHHTEHPR